MACDCKWPGENWNCPECYHGAPRPDRCQTCGSDDPGWYIEDGPEQSVCRWNKLLGCPDDFHPAAE